MYIYIYIYTEHEKDAKNGPWEFAFGTVMLLLMLSWIIFVATCITVKCCYNKRIHRHNFRNNQQLSGKNMHGNYYTPVSKYSY